MKVFVVMEGYYSDRGIDRIFLNEELAKTYLMRKRANCFSDWESNSHYMEVYDTSDDEIEFTQADIEKANKEIKMGYAFCLNKSGDPSGNGLIEYRTLYNDDDFSGSLFRSGHGFSMCVVAKDASDAEYERCLKVARDRRAELLANKKHIN